MFSHSYVKLPEGIWFDVDIIYIYCIYLMGVINQLISGISGVLGNAVERTTMITKYHKPPEVAM